MVRSTLMLALCSRAAAAIAETTINMHFLGFTYDGIQGSIVDANSETTTVSLNCPSGIPEDDECQYLDKYTLMYGPSTAEYTVTSTINADVTMTNIGNCKLQISEDLATCTGTGVVVESGSTNRMTQEIVTSSFTAHPLSVTITAGIEKLDQNGDAAIPGTSATVHTSIPTSSPTSFPASDCNTFPASFVSAAEDFLNVVKYTLSHNIILAGVAVFIGVVGLLLWRARAQRQVDLPALEAVPRQNMEGKRWGS